MTEGPASLLSILPDVPRETLDRLEAYVACLRQWQSVKNLVGPSTLDVVWSRHIADSLQLATMTNDDVWVDLGSGAGLPGLIVAIGRPGTLVHLVESDSRKCAFLRAAGRATGANVKVWDSRIEVSLPALQPRPRTVTARALAPLANLLDYGRVLWRDGASGVFPKGRDYERELTEARRSWTFDSDVLPSRVDPDGRILRVRRVRPATSSPN